MEQSFCEYTKFLPLHFYSQVHLKQMVCSLKNTTFFILSIDTLFLLIF